MIGVSTFIASFHITLLELAFLVRIEGRGAKEKVAGFLEWSYNVPIKGNSMIIFARLFASLSFLFYYKIFKDKDLLKDLETAPNGLQYNVISEVGIFIPIKQKFYFRILKETAWHRFCKKLGLGVEFQTGNLEFDQTYYIEADHKALLNIIQMNDELKQLVMKLAGKGVLSIQSTGRGVLKIKTQEGVVSSLFEELLELTTPS